MEEKKDGRVCEDNVITKNPMFYLQQGIKAFLKCLGFESPNLVDTNKKEQEDGNKQGSDSSNDNYKNDPPVQAVYEDPPQSQTLVVSLLLLSFYKYIENTHSPFIR